MTTARNFKQRDAIDRALSERNRPTAERLERANGAYVDLATRSAGVVRMLDESDNDRQRMRALPKVNRWAADVLRRVYLLSRRNERVVGDYGAVKRGRDLERERVADYAETLIVECRTEAHRHWSTLRAALIDDAWSIRDRRRLGTALRWLAAFWRKRAMSDGVAWLELVEALSLEVEEEDEGRPTPVDTPSDVHLWLALALTGQGFRADEVGRLADELRADRDAILAQLCAWERQGLVRRRKVPDEPVMWCFG